MFDIHLNESLCVLVQVLEVLDQVLDLYKLMRQIDLLIMFLAACYRNHGNLFIDSHWF